ncbi:hypothetical protein [Nocardia sp. 852002-51244_SCH5132740]|uniref:hypothetical protein n=1 Tax=Nocardia sp. 852002-51244_SCH5132740 TaxID=1834099 RepID=UPI0007EBD6BA|nr:hypothetical protein [Nocardia sp. 852002-51244_SCH5132740]OBB38722.1 hypothetical protein A5748_02310 [Nocardia sp. 852002-51244_SCH5132740]
MTTISEIADSITERTDIDRDAALTLATTYAAQCGYQVPEGGQAPDAEIGTEDAEFIIEAAGAGADSATPSLLDEIAEAAASIETATDRRDNAIRKAIRDGQPVVQIAKAARLSRERIYQIRDRRR